MYCQLHSRSIGIRFKPITLILCILIQYDIAIGQGITAIPIEQSNEVSDHWDSVVEQTMPLLHRAPHNARLLARMADAYTSIGIPDSALRYWDLVIAIDSANDTACYRAALLHIAHGQIDSAAARIQVALQLRPDSLRYSYLLMQILIHQQQWQPARQLCDDVTRYHADIPDVLLLSGIIDHHLHHDTAAITAYTQCLSLHPAYPAALTARATSYLILRRYPDALADYTTAHADTIADAEVQNNIGVCRYHTQDYKGAIIAFKRSIALYDDPGAVLFYNRGIAYLSSMRYDSAAIDLHTADILWQSPPLTDSTKTASMDALYYLAQCYKRTGDIRTAYTLLDKVRTQGGYKGVIEGEMWSLKWSLWIADYWYYVLAILLLMMGCWVVVRRLR